MRSILLLLLSLLMGGTVFAKERPPVIHRITLPPKPDFSPFEWLVGDWTGKTLASGPQGEVNLSVTYDLGQRVMVFREQVTFSATTTLPESKETWMGILSPGAARKDFVLRVFSDTGFITRYRVSADGGEVSFNPEGGEQPPPGWLFRRVLQRPDVGQILEIVEVAPPGKSFFDYYSALLTRKTAK